MMDVSAYSCAQGETANDLWHMDNFSYGAADFLISIVPPKAAMLDVFQLFGALSRLNDAP